MNIKSCGYLNVRKNKEINNDKQYIALDISLELGCLDKRKFTSSGPRYYVLRPGKDLTNPLTLMNRRRPKNKQKERTATTDVAINVFVEITENFKFLPYLGYRRKE